MLATSCPGIGGLRGRAFREVVQKTVADLNLPLRIRNPWYLPFEMDPDVIHVYPQHDALPPSELATATSSPLFRSYLSSTDDYLTIDLKNGGINECRMMHFYDEHTVDRAVRVYTCFLDLAHALGMTFLPYPDGLRSEYVRDILLFVRETYKKNLQRDSERRKELEQAVWNVWFDRAARPGAGALYKLYERDFEAAAGSP